MNNPYITIGNQSISQYTKETLTYEYDETYLGFINQDIMNFSQVGFEDYNEWFVNELIALGEIDLTEDEQYNYNFAGIMDPFTTTINLLSNELFSSEMVTLLQSYGLNISNNLTENINHYTINIIPQTEGQGAGFLLNESRQDQSEWQEGTLLINSDINNFTDVFLEEFLHALGHGHDGRYNRTDEPSEVVGEVYGRNLVANTSYGRNQTDTEAKNILSANLEILWHNMGAVQSMNASDNDGQARYKIGFGDDKGNGTVENIVDFGGIDTIELATSYNDANGTLGTAYANMNISGVLATQTVDTEGNIGVNYATLMHAVDVGQTSFTGSLIENLITGNSHDVIWGNETNNTIESTGGDNTIYGSLGQDTVTTGGGSDIFYSDRFDVAPLSLFASDAAGNLKRDAKIFIEDGNSSITIYAGDGNDMLYGTWNADTLNGEGGNDLLLGNSFLYKNANSNGQNYDVAFGDTFNGGNGNDIIIGGYGDDTIEGGDDNDILFGSLGNDTITGGHGIDLFYFKDEKSGSYTIDSHDTITDFTFHTDKIAIEYELLFTPEQIGQYNGFSTFLDKEEALVYLVDNGLLVEDIAANNLTFNFINGDTLTLDNTLFSSIATTSAEAVEIFFDNFEILTPDTQSSNMVAEDGLRESIEDAISSLPATEREIQNRDILEYYDEVKNTSTGIIQAGGFLNNLMNFGTDFADLFMVDLPSIALSTGDGHDIVEMQSITSTTVMSQIDMGNGDDAFYGNINTENVYGGNGNDLFFGNGGSDILNGEEGDDFLDGGTGADVLNGGTGTDTASYRTSTAGLTINLLTNTHSGDAAGDTFSSIEIFEGSDFNDTLIADNTGRYLKGADGNDDIDGGNGNDILYGDDGADTIHGSDGNDEIYGGRGDDTLYAGTGIDILYGGDGNDFIDAKTTSSTDRATIYGGNGDDIIKGSKGSDGLYGGTGNDDIVGSVGRDTIEGGTGDDIINGQGSDDIIDGNQGQDTIYGGSGGDTINGGDDNDSVYGESGADTLSGNAGDDVLYGGSGSDILYGGSGNDILDGHSGNEVLYGNQGDDVLYGGAWADTLYGGNHDDTLYGGQSNDNLTGGSGADTFIFNTGDGHDVITDFTTTEGDTLVLDQSAFDPGTTLSDIASSAFINSNGDLRINVDTGGSITLEGMTSISIAELEWLA